jgi:hypothetical protein
MALEYLQISMDEYKTFRSATTTTEVISRLHGIDAITGRGSSLLTVDGFLTITSLTYCDFLNLYLFLQQETAALYRQLYGLAVQTAQDAQEAFKFERGDIERNFLTNLAGTIFMRI